MNNTDFALRSDEYTKLFKELVPGDKLQLNNGGVGMVRTHPATGMLRGHLSVDITVEHVPLRSWVEARPDESVFLIS